MPASLFPIVFPALLVLVPLLCLVKGFRLFLRAAGLSVFILVSLFLAIYLPGRFQMLRAVSGDRAAMYELARWTEKHDEQIGRFILWPVEPDVLGGYRILEKSAAQGYPPAIYALGVRLKHGDFVPCPADWDGPAGNHFPQPVRGQPLIDRALELGYHPTIEEAQFYFGEYRK